MRLLLALLIILSVCGTTTAQQTPVAEISVAREGGTASLLISRGGMVNMLDLLRLYADTRGAMVIADPRKYSGEFNVTVPEGGSKLSGADLDVFIQDGLHQSHIAMYWNKTGVIALCAAVEIGAYTETIAEEDLDKANPAVWARVIMRLRHTDANTIRMGLQNVIARNGGQVNAIPPGTLMLIERVDRLRSLVKAAREMDNKEAQVLRTHEVPEGANADACLKSLRELFPPHESYSRFATPRFTAVAGTRKVVVLAKEDQHVLITEALAKLK